jgi:hypothetical protein
VRRTSSRSARSSLRPRSVFEGVSNKRLISTSTNDTDGGSLMIASAANPTTHPLSHCLLTHLSTKPYSHSRHHHERYHPTSLALWLPAFPVVAPGFTATVLSFPHWPWDDRGSQKGSAARRAMSVSPRRRRRATSARPCPYQTRPTLPGPAETAALTFNLSSPCFPSFSDSGHLRITFLSNVVVRSYDRTGSMDCNTGI